MVGTVGKQNFVVGVMMGMVGAATVKNFKWWKVSENYGKMVGVLINGGIGRGINR